MTAANIPIATGVPATTTRTTESEEVTSPTSTELPDSPMEEAHRSADRHPVGYVPSTDLATTSGTHHETQTKAPEVKSGLPAPVPSGGSPNTEVTKKSAWYKRFSASSKPDDSRQTKGKFSSAGIGDKPVTATKGDGKSTAMTTPTKATPTPEKTSERDNVASATPYMAAGAGAAAIGGTAGIVDENRGRRTERDISPVSSVSSLRHSESEAESDQEFEEARDNFDDSLAPPSTSVADKSTSPSRASKFTEVV